MAEKFGLDWKDHDAQRMAKFVDIFLWESERENKDAKKAEGSKKSFR